MKCKVALFGLTLLVVCYSICDAALGQYFNAYREQEEAPAHYKPDVSSQGDDVLGSDDIEKRYMRFGRRSNSDNVANALADYAEDDEETPSLSAAADKRYMRFGKRYMRFGKRYMRFGRR